MLSKDYLVVGGDALKRGAAYVQRRSDYPAPGSPKIQRQSEEARRREWKTGLETLPAVGLEDDNLQIMAERESIAMPAEPLPQILLGSDTTAVAAHTPGPFAVASLLEGDVVWAHNIGTSGGDETYTCLPPAEVDEKYLSFVVT